ncbi:hypothetical protein LCGC14_2533210 [marine sediment metagenome]|uniref:Uncharacterized protein n=1 Tax=marine sediment metagenome TaxID=412755 RepID=A0A0F9DL61_9ZZZZ
MPGSWQHRFSKMTPMQRGILSKIYDRITLCEGKGMPEAYWCDSCISSRVRVLELFARFEQMNNANHILSATTTTHPGFKEFDST